MSSPGGASALSTHEAEARAKRRTAAGGNARRRVVVASKGAGPLLQRDYRAVIENCDCTPEETMEKVRSGFADFSPREIADFSCEENSFPISVGHEMRINLRLSGFCHVRIVHTDERSLTMRTLGGHPEAGRITFGAYYDPADNVIFRIRSRARASSRLRYVGYELFGKGMQTEVWTTFIERVAVACHGAIRGKVRITEAWATSTPKRRWWAATWCWRSNLDVFTFAL